MWTSDEDSKGDGSAGTAAARKSRLWSICQNVKIL